MRMCSAPRLVLGFAPCPSGSALGHFCLLLQS